MRLDGKRAVVTGASSGIGAAIARRFAAEGCSLFLAGGQNAEGLRGAAEACRRAGVAVEAEAFDLAGVEEAARLAERAVAALGPPDILVNCAGARCRKPVEGFTPEDLRRLIHVNLVAPFILCGRLAPPMARRGWGRILNVGSTAGEAGVASNALYCATKGGLHSMTRALAVELGPRGVRVNAIAPGTTLSEGTKGRLEADPGWAERLRREIPLGRFGLPEEVAALAAFLASEEADYINGAIVVVDGGRLSH